MSGWQPSWPPPAFRVWSSAGQAVLLYGEPRTTKDIDITLGIGVEGYSRVREVSNRLGLRIIPADPEEFDRSLGKKLISQFRQLADPASPRN